MSKENNSKNGPRKTGKNTGRRFGKRRENYVDSFRWGFVEGETMEDVGPDDELFYGETEDESAEPRDKKGKRSENRKGADKSPRTEKKEPEKSNAPADAASRRNRKKQPKKMVSPTPLFDDEDDDLNLPSYGRTPIPTDEELPPLPSADKTAVKGGGAKKENDRNRREKEAKKSVAPQAVASKTEGRRKESEPRKEPPRRESVAPAANRQRDDERDTPKPDRPRREQMVWDPDKREYVPLVVPESIPSKKAGFKREAEKREPRKNERENRKPVAEPMTPPASEIDEIPKNSRRSRPQKKTSQTEFVAPESKPAAAVPEPAPVKAEEPKKDAPKKRKRSGKKSSAVPVAETPAPKPATPSQGVGKRPERRHAGRPEAVQPRGDVPPMVESNVPDPSDTESEVRGFAELGVSETMLEALKVVRYLEPTPIQAGVFKQVQAGTDVMGQAQTGTGKTAAFSIPIIEGVEECPPGNDPVALILVPTRELAVQVRDEATRLCYGRDVRVSACYGGKPIAKQISKLRDGVDIVVGTPGRVLDLMNRHALTLDALRWVVLDEADRMLDIGFRPDIEKILKRTPKDRQTLLFSATLPPAVVRLAEKYMKTPEILDFSNKGVAVDTIEQYYVTVDPERKFDALLYLLEEEQPNQAIIFTRTKRGADRLARHLSKRMDSLAAIHGDLSQGERDRVMGQFRSGKLRYLVATDVVGRGIDVSGISHIINFDIPAFCDDYVHRVGRTGRMGREGVAYTFVTVQEGSELTRIEMRIDKLLKRADLKGFESFTKPADPNANLDELMSETPSETKPVYGKAVRKIRRAL